MKSPIALDNFDLPPETMAILESEISKMGIGGALRLGAIRARPEMVYFLWHTSGEVPVSMTALRSELEPTQIRGVVDCFKTKWQRRLQ